MPDSCHTDLILVLCLGFVAGWYAACCKQAASVQRETGAESAPLPDVFIRKVDDYLEVHFHEESLDVGTLAKALFISSGHLTRKLKEKTGLTTEQYLLRYRLERALELLRTTDKTINEITDSVGIKDPAHFSRAFKKQFGLTPKEIRKIR